MTYDDLNDHEKQSYEKCKKLMVELINETNSMAGDDGVILGMLEGMIHSHRTLQQCFFKMFKVMLTEYAKTDSDLRNAASVAFAKKVDEIDWHFPYI